MKRMRVVVTMLSLVGGLALSTRAWAQAADEYSMIVLDETGSMDVPGSDNQTILNGQPVISTEVFDNAVSAAINWATTDRANATISGNHRAYAIYTFKDDVCCGGAQAGLTKIWPVAPQSGATFDCDPAVDNSHMEPGTAFCLFDSGQTAPYDSMIDALNSVRKAANGIGGDPHNFLSVINTGAQPKGGASYDTSLYGLGPNTPLANAVCDAAERLVLATAIKNLTFTLETDGGENFSPSEPFHACSGATGGLAAGVTTFTKSHADWDLPAGSWQGNVMRRLTRFGQVPTFPNVKAGGPTNNDAQDQTIIAARAITTPPDDVLTNSKWRIDVHFNICDSSLPNSPPPCPGVLPGTAALQFAPLTSSASFGDAMKLVPVPPPPKLASATSSNVVVAAAAPAPTRTQSISPTELAFFSAVGHVNSKSTFRTFVRDPKAAAPVHKPKIPGDIDDSGCTDHADFSIVTQNGVYYQQAVQPNQLAIRADLNGDGWVNKLDALIVLANWGKGCINNPGPKPKLTF